MVDALGPASVLEGWRAPFRRRTITQSVVEGGRRASSTPRWTLEIIDIGQPLVPGCLWNGEPITATLRDLRVDARSAAALVPSLLGLPRGLHCVMRPLDYLRILRRRWWILVVGVLIGSLLAYATRPSELTVLKATAPSISYRAQHLLQSVDGDGSSKRAVDYDRLALNTIAGPVPDAAIKSLGGTLYNAAIAKQEATSSDTKAGGAANSAVRNRLNSDSPGVPSVRQGKGVVSFYVKDFAHFITVAAVPDPATGALSITATGAKDLSIQTANAFADELQASLVAKAKARYDASLARTTSDRDGVTSQLGLLDGQIALTPDPVLHNQLAQKRATLSTRVDELNQTILQLLRDGPGGSPLETLSRAVPERVTLIAAPGGSALDPNQRMMLGGAIGFFLALALLVITELLGARIRDVGGTEGAARMPVIAEIPVVKMDRADRFMVATSAAPASLTAEAYRSLRTSLLAMWQRHPKNVAYAGSGAVAAGQGGRPLRTLLVTSPGPAEGKSISVVNLAAAFAETGVSVIVIDADFRRPTQTRYFDRPRNPNMGDLDLTCEPDDLEAILQDTEVPGVRLAASAPTKSDPGHAIAVAKATVAAAMQLADIVIVDSPPILLANDAADLALGVDASILLARSGWTRRSGIVSAADLLRRLEATVIGVVIVGAEHGVRAGYYGYYGYYGYGYGYAHPGEVSIVKRLLPWKVGKKGGVRSGPPSRTTVGVPTPSTGSERLPARPSGPDADDPWV